MKCTEQTPVYSIHTQQELIVRLLNELDLIAPLSGFCTVLKVEADNATEPAIITVGVHDREEFVMLFDYTIDQNTTFWEFCLVIRDLHNVIITANYAYENNIKYGEAEKRLEEERKERNKDLPF